MLKLLKHFAFWFCLAGTLFSIVYFFIVDIPLYIKLIGAIFVLYVAYDLLTERKKNKETREA